MIPIASAATKTPAAAPNSARPDGVRDDRDHRRRAHDRCRPRLRAQRDRERQARGDRGEDVRPAERRVRHALRRRAEPARGDRAADADAEDEPEKLDERHRRVCDARLQVLGRELAHADRERHSGQQRHEGGERHDVRRRVSEPEVGDHGGAEARAERGERRKHHLGPRRALAPTSAIRRRRARPCRRHDLTPAAAEDRRHGGAGERVSTEPHEPTAARSGRLAISVEPRRALPSARYDRPEHVVHDVVEPRDRVEVDRLRPYAERVAPLRRERSEGELDERRRRRDLRCDKAEARGEQPVTRSSRSSVG